MFNITDNGKWGFLTLRKDLSIFTKLSSRKSSEGYLKMFNVLSVQTVPVKSRNGFSPDSPANILGGGEHVR